MEKWTKKGETRMEEDPTAPHFQAVANLEFFINDKCYATGTGFLVEFERKKFILSCAHCFKDDKSGKMVELLQISLGQQSERRPYGIIQKRFTEDVCISCVYDEGEPDPHDYAIIRLNESDDPQLPDTTFYLDENNFHENKSLRMNGYPTSVYERGRKVNGGGRQYVTKVIPIQDDTFPFDDFYCYQDATTHGNSGSPIYYEEDNNFFVVGIHCVGKDMSSAVDPAAECKNYGLRVNESVRLDIKRILLDPEAYKKLINTNSFRALKRHALSIEEERSPTFPPEKIFKAFDQDNNST